MTTVVMRKALPGAATSHPMHAIGELVLRLTGAALQVVATLVVVRALAPAVAGIYFEGFVVAYTLAALLRGKYEMLILRYVLDDGAAQTCIPMIDLLAALSRRIAIRCVLVCGVLLVLTADLDIMEPRLRPFLDTFLPFVLAVPFVAVALFLSTALRAARQSLGSMIISAYAVNMAIIAASALNVSSDPLSTLSWAFPVGAVLASAFALVLVRRAFPTTPMNGAKQPCLEDWRQIYGAAALDYGIAGVAYPALLWGPLCVLAVAGPALQIAEIAVAMRLALIVEIMIPALMFVPLDLQVTAQLTRALRTERGRLVANVALTAVAATGLIVVLVILVPHLLREFGAPYTELAGLTAIMLASQGLSAAGRPAIRFVTAGHYAPVLRALCVSAATAVVMTLLGVGQFGALAVAVATLSGMVILNGYSLIAAVRQAGLRPAA